MLVFDLETIADKDNESYLNYKLGSFSAPSTWKDPEKIARNIEEQKQKAMQKLSLSPMTGRIAIAGFISDDLNLPWLKISPFEDRQDELYSIVTFGLDGQTEKTIIEMMLMIINNSYQDGHSLITYNGKAFDLPFLFTRAILKGIAKPKDLPPITDYISKYPPRQPFIPHIDLFNILNPGYGDWSGLSEWSYLLGDTNEPFGEGNKVQEWFDTNQYDKIKEHLISDLHKTLYLADRVLKWI